ncbi:GrpB family protein [Candidatus Latescibacterota bacterium]
MSSQSENTNAPIRFVPYDAQYPGMFDEESRRIAGLIRPAISAIEHIGSTAVPDLGGKPIIDIMIGLCVLDAAAKCIEPLEELGYEYVPGFEAFFPERRFFRKGPPVCRTHHIHMVELTSDFWNRHIAFRDYLRTNDDSVREYHLLKKGLARRFKQDRDGYTDAKSAFIENILLIASSDMDR